MSQRGRAHRVAPVDTRPEPTVNGERPSAPRASCPFGPTKEPPAGRFGGATGRRRSQGHGAGRAAHLLFFEFPQPLILPAVVLSDKDFPSIHITGRISSHALGCDLSLRNEIHHLAIPQASDTDAPKPVAALVEIGTRLAIGHVQHVVRVDEEATGTLN